MPENPSSAATGMQVPARQKVATPEYPPRTRQFAKKDSLQEGARSDAVFAPKKGNLICRLICHEDMPDHQICPVRTWNCIVSTLWRSCNIPIKTMPYVSKASRVYIMHCGSFWFESGQHTIHQQRQGLAPHEGWLSLSPEGI